MKINKIFIIGLMLLAVIALSTVSAADALQGADNETVTADDSDNLQITAEDTVSDGEKKDYNITSRCANEIVKGDHSYETTLYFTDPDNAEPNPVSIYVDGKLYRTVDIDWIFQGEVPPNVPTGDLSVGNHVLTISFPGNDYYNTQNLSYNFNVVNSKIYIPDVYDLSETSNIVLKTTEDATGSLIVKVNGKEFKKVALKYDPDDEVNYARISLAGLKPGSYEIEAIYTGDSKFKKQTVKKTVNVTYSIETYDYITSYGEPNNSIDIYLPEDVKNIPTVTVDGQNFKVIKESQGHFIANMTYSPIGEHTAYITYPGDSIYPEKTVNLTLKTNGEIVAHTSQGWGENAILLILPENAQGNLTVYVNDEPYQTKELIGGFAKIYLDLPLQRYNIKATYTGNDYNISDYNENFRVEPIFDYEYFIYYATPLEMKIHMNADCKGNFSYNPPYLSDPIPLEIINGSTNLTIDTSKLSFFESGDGEYFTVFFKYDDGNYSETYSKSFFVRVLPSKITNVKDVTMYYGDIGTYSAKVYGDYGTPVAFPQDNYIHIQIGSIKVTQFSDKNGIVKIKIGSNTNYILRNSPEEKDNIKIKLLPGKYKITTTYHGAKITTKLTIKQPLSLKTVKVKKSAKKLVLTATLKKGKTPIKNKKITFKFNGKKYTAKTNKKGVAKVTVKKTVLKKLKVGKKITYSATYLQDTVKKTVKVKK